VAQWRVGRDGITLTMHSFGLTPDERSAVLGPTRVRWRIVGLLLGFSIVSYVLRVNITIAGEPIMHEFHLTPVQLGWVFSAFLFSYTAFMTPAGTWADRFGSHLTLAVIGVSWSALTFLTALVPGFALTTVGTVLGSLLVIRTLLGVCEAPIYPAALKAISNWVAERERAFSNGVVISGALLASAVTAPVISLLMVHLGWRNALMLTSLVAPVLVLAWLVYATDDPLEHRAINAREFEIIAGCGGTGSNATKPARRRPAGWKVVLKSGQAWRLFTAYGCQNYLGYVFIWWGYIYLVEARHFSLVRGGLVTAAPFILGTIATPSAGALSDRLTDRLGKRQGRRLVPVVAMTFSAILVFVGSRIADARLAVAILSVGAALCWTPEGPTWASTMEIASPVAGTAVGFVNTGGNLGGFLAALLTPHFAKQIGWVGAFDVASLLAIAGAVVWAGVNPSLAKALST
jgi:ACS family glucarate transporter-like MFS transporter